MILNKKRIPDNEVSSNYYSGKKYIAAYSKIYQLFYSNAQKQFYAQCIYSPCFTGCSFTPKNKYKYLSANEVNNMVGFQLLNDK